MSGTQHLGSSYLDCVIYILSTFSIIYILSTFSIIYILSKFSVIYIMSRFSVIYILSTFSIIYILSMFSIIYILSTFSFIYILSKFSVIYILSKFSVIYILSKLSNSKVLLSTYIHCFLTKKKHLKNFMFNWFWTEPLSRGHCIYLSTVTFVNSKNCMVLLNIYVLIKLLCSQWTLEGSSVFHRSQGRPSWRTVPEGENIADRRNASQEVRDSFLSQGKLL